MGIFDRLTTLLKSNINELISSAENPEKMLNQIIVDMRSQLVKAKQQVAAAIADEKRLRDQADAELRQAQDWENRAVLAVREGRDDLAKQALVRQNEHLAHGQQLETTWQSHRDETEKLKNALRDLNDKIEEAKRKKNLLIARQRRAQAQKRISETMSSLSEKSAFEAFARMEERIDQSERQIRASAEIDEEFTGDRLAKDFKQLEQGAGAQDADFRLLQLKQQMGMLGGAVRRPGASNWVRARRGAGARRAGLASAGPALPRQRGTSGTGVRRRGRSPQRPRLTTGSRRRDVEEIPGRAQASVAARAWPAEGRAAWRGCGSGGCYGDRRIDRARSCGSSPPPPTSCCCCSSRADGALSGRASATTSCAGCGSRAWWRSGSRWCDRGRRPRGSCGSWCRRCVEQTRG